MLQRDFSTIGSSFRVEDLAYEMALDQNYYMYAVRRDNRDTLDADDDSALISRARDVISRATGQMPSISGGIDHQRLIIGDWNTTSYETPLADTHNGGRDRDREDHRYMDRLHDDYESSYRHEEKKNRTRTRRRERRREERKAVSDRPCRTVLVKHLPAVVDEGYLRGILQIFGAPIQDVRLVKHKDSGASRGFAFVEFQFLPDAQRWMEENQGYLVIGDARASLTYSKSRGDEDWFCSQCGTQNFKRRSNCFKCQVEKNESERYSQISTVPTRILLLMGIDTLTSEEKIQKELHDVTAVDMNIQLIKDPATNISRGLCYVAVATIDIASHLLEILNNMHPPFVIDGKQITVHFCREGSEEDVAAWTEAEGVAASPYYNQQYYQQTEAATVASSYDQTYAAYTTSQHTSTAGAQYTELSTADKVALAQEQVQAARKMQQEQQEITQQLLQKLRQGNSSPSSSTTPSSSSSSSSHSKKKKKGKVDLPPPGTDGEPSVQNQMLATVIQEQQHTDPNSQWAAASGATEAQTLQHQSSTGSETSYYPDTSQYQYDETSGFYYDPQTGLYYDPNSQYYYNAHSQQYMYWDGTQYVPAQHQASSTPPTLGVPPEKEKEEKTKKEKGKVAKKVASDMRRWAATMNEIKNQKSKKGPNDAKRDSSSATADAGFAVLSKKADPNETKQSVMLALKRSATTEEVRMKAAKSSITNILAQYGGDSDSEPEDSEPPPSKKQATSSASSQGSGGAGGQESSRESVPSSLTDWSKLICLLCKRQFPSREVLVKHQQFSDLHKQNLVSLAKRTGVQASGGDATTDVSYRDRAQERRSRFTSK